MSFSGNWYLTPVALYATIHSVKEIEMNTNSINQVSLASTCSIKFSFKPANDIIENLKANGFKWNGAEWQKKCNNKDDVRNAASVLSQYGVMVLHELTPEIENRLIDFGWTGKVALFIDIHLRNKADNKAYLVEKSFADLLTASKVFRNETP